MLDPKIWPRLIIAKNENAIILKLFSQETLRTALAKGADKAILIEVDENTEAKLEPIHVAKAFAKIAKDDKFDIVFLGKQAIDDDANQTGQLVAGLLNWPQATFASKVEPSEGEIFFKFWKLMNMTVTFQTNPMSQLHGRLMEDSKL